MQSIIPGHMIAFEHINEREDIFPNHLLRLGKSADCSQNPLKALRKAIELVQDSILSCDSHTNNQSTITSPIVLCCPWSAFSELTAPIFAEFGKIQISTSSSANTLSGSPAFFRTIPNADLAVKAYIPLCKHFGWNKIAIVYINDAYGVDHKNQIEIQAKSENIDVESIAFEYGISNQTTKEETIKQATDLIKKLKIYITIIISSSADLRFVLEQFNANNMLEYPYYYMFRTTQNSIKAQGLSNLTQGFLAVQPFFPALITKEQYINFNVYDGNITIWESSNKIYSSIKQDWLDYYKNDPAVVYNALEPHDYTAWAYDSAYATSLTLNYLIESGFDLFDYNTSELIEAIKYYLINELSFIGATGTIEMDKNGNRLHGYYMYGFINDSGEFEPIGVIGEDGIITINSDAVQWPNYFHGKASESPLSEPFVDITSIAVDESVYWSVISLCILFIFIILIFIILIWKEREHPIMAKSSYKLSIIVSIGCILALLLVAIQRTGDYACVVTWYGYSIAFTLIFMPIFARLYRLDTIMNSNNIDYTRIEEIETKLHKGIFIMFIFDVILFIIVTCIHFVHGNISTLQFVPDNAIQSNTDPLLITQNEYETCQTDDIQVATAFDVLIIIYKLVQFGFGMYYFFSIFRFKYQTPNNDEISAVLLSIVLSILIFVIIITFSFANSDSYDITKKYALNSFMIILLIVLIILIN